MVGNWESFETSPSFCACLNSRPSAVCSPIAQVERSWFPAPLAT